MSPAARPANDDSSTPLFTAGEVESRTTIPIATLRQWERRYGLPSPGRAASGYRLYSRDDLACVEFMRARVAEGVPPSRAAELYRLSNAAGSTGQSGRSAPDLGLVDGAGGLVERLVAALADGDHDDAAVVLADSHAALAVEDVLTRVVGPAMVEIGERWHRGEITVAHEHRATGLILGRLHALLDLLGLARRGPVAVVACAPGERHELGALMLAVLLRRAGVRAHYLGADTPIEDLARFAREVRADAVLVSAGSIETVELLRQDAGRLRESARLLVLGGRGFLERPALARELGGEYLGGDAAAAVDGLLARLET